MDTVYINPCTRCGKQRIIAKTWTEDVVAFFGTSTVTYTETVCPDPECQKIVEEKLEAQKQKSREMQDAKEKRLKEKMANKTKHA